MPSGPVKPSKWPSGKRGGAGEYATKRKSGSQTSKNMDPQTTSQVATGSGVSAISQHTQATPNGSDRKQPGPSGAPS